MSDVKYDDNNPKSERVYCIATSLAAINCAMAAIGNIHPDGEVIPDYAALQQVTRPLSEWRDKLYEEWGVISEGISND